MGPRKARGGKEDNCEVSHTHLPRALARSLATGNFVARSVHPDTASERASSASDTLMNADGMDFINGKRRERGRERWGGLVQNRFCKGGLTEGVLRKKTDLVFFRSITSPTSTSVDSK